MPCKAFICGYDPMNMFRVGVFIYCKHFILLNINGTVRNINSEAVLQLDENSNQNVIGHYLAKQQQCKARANARTWLRPPDC